ncbi:helix-turn-helix domain-containing protein [Clostridioides difficile]|nr:helix-turn-helix domain-containing protein [Clostridioides difficile]
MSVALQFIDTKDLVQELMQRDDTTDIIKMFLDREGIKRMELMTIEEFCEYLKISDVTARNMAREAMITKDFIALKIGRKYMIDRISFEEFIMKNAMKDKDVMKKKKGSDLVECKSTDSLYTVL